MANSPLRPRKGSMLNGVYSEDLKPHITQQQKALCARLGVEYVEDEVAATEMWAQIGERLALQQPEFVARKSRGRPRLKISREAQLAGEVDRIKAGDPSLSDRAIVEIL